MASVVDEITSVLAHLSPAEQERVLTYARELANPPVFPHTPLPPGSPPDALLRIRVDPEVGEAMERAWRTASGSTRMSSKLGPRKP